MTAAALPPLHIDLPFPATGRARVAWAIAASALVHGLALGWLPGLPTANSLLWEPLEVYLPVPAAKAAGVQVPPATHQEVRAERTPSVPVPLLRPQIADKALDTTEVKPDWLARSDPPLPDTMAATSGAAILPPPLAEATEPTAPDPAALASFGRAVAGAVAAQQRYPRLAQLRQWQGTAILQLELAPDGQLKAVRVLSSSGHEILDRQALEMVRAAAPLPPPPAGLSGRALAVDIPVVFRLAS